MTITKESIRNSLQFMSIFISLYESLSDYIIDCPKQIFGDDNIIKEDCLERIAEIEKAHLAEKQKAIDYLKSCDKSQISKKQLDDIECIANYDYIKQKDNGFVNWLSPKYNKLICNKSITVRGKKEKKILFNSLSFFIDLNAVTQQDFDDFIELRDIRNRFVHEMPTLMLENVFATNKSWLDKIINIYKKINNFWSNNFELSICGEEELPDNIDYDNTITTDLYNLFLSIDILFNTNYVGENKYKILRGLYKCIMLPIKKEENK